MQTKTTKLAQTTSFKLNLDFQDLDGYNKQTFIE